MPTSLNARVDTPDHGLLHPFKSTGAVANGFDRHKSAFVKSLFVSNCSWIHLDFKCHTDRNEKGWGLANVGAVPRKLRMYVLLNFSLFLLTNSSMLNTLFMALSTRININRVITVKRN